MLINQASTAIEHFHQSVKPHASKTHQAILDYMDMHHNKPNWTIGELAHGMGMEKSTISARRNEMIRLGLLGYDGNRRCSFSNIMCQTVKRKV